MRRLVGVKSPPGKISRAVADNFDPRAHQRDKKAEKTAKNHLPYPGTFTVAY
jgi:hypothetical protein